jgi:ABC-type sugar transport system ATPase subunit
MPLIRVSGLAKAFGPTRALRNANLDVMGGEIHALVGENGSGKSTLVKILSGVHLPDSGELALDDVVIDAPGRPAAAQSMGIVTVFQEVLVAEARSVLDNIWLGADGFVRWRVPTAVKRERAAEVLNNLRGGPIDLDQAIEGLSLSERQTCCIARALVRNPRLLILDEATSALDVEVRDRLFGVLRRLRSTGVAVIFITHRLDEIAELGDRITVMRNGESVCTMERAAYSPSRLVELMSGGSLDEAARVAESQAARPAAGHPVLRLRDVRLGAGRRPLNFAVHPGEVVGVAGLEGHGQDAFLDVVRGLKPVTGEAMVTTSAGEVALRSPVQAAKHGVAFVARERRQASFAWMSIRENFGMPTLKADTRWKWLRTRATARRFDGFVSQLGILLGASSDRITTLSGGNQQKVIIARWLAAHPRVLVLNDPTRGIDVGAKRDFYRLLGTLATSGMAVVMASSEVDEHLELMDRVVVFREHELVDELQREALTRPRLIAAFFGQDAEAEPVEGGER